MLALADKQIVSLQKALAAAELQVGVVKGRATSSASALDGPATDGLADGLQNGVSTEASTWDQLAAEVKRYENENVYCRTACSFLIFIMILIIFLFSFYVTREELTYFLCLSFVCL